MYAWIDRLERDLRQDQGASAEADVRQLKSLVDAALGDRSQSDWMNETAKIEALIVKLIQSFRVKDAPKLDRP